jgi:hypothetical protein
MLRLLVPCLLAFVVLTGCSGSGGTAIEPYKGYPEFETFDSDAMMMVGPPASAGDWAEVKKGASHPTFIQEAEAIANSQVPAGIANGKALKDDLSAKLNHLIEVAQKQKAADVEAAYQEFLVAWSKLAEAVSAAR